MIPAPAPDLGSDAVVAVDPVVRPARNPFCLALLVASLLLLVAAGAIFWKAATASSQYDFGDPWQSFVQELLFTAPQALMTAGLLGVVGWIVLGAVHRGGR